MANKKRIEERNKVARQKQTERMIQIIGFGVVLVLILGGGWYFSSRGKTPTQTHLSSSDAPACAPFSDIKPAGEYSQPPMRIDVSKQYFARVKMAKGGEFVIQLYPDKAPITVNSFVFLACKNYFNGVTFHRVLEGFMAQGGDPTGTGGGGPGYEFVNEDSDLTFDKPGVVAMANAGRDTNGSQFFITFDTTPQLNGGYTIFGQVIEGMDVVNGIKRRDPDQNPNYQGDAIQTIEITEQ
jgi:cyclophilin family peptidyl-prolyl cis-trans isomerase